MLTVTAAQEARASQHTSGYTGPVPQDMNVNLQASFQWEMDLHLKDSSVYLSFVFRHHT